MSKTYKGLGAHIYAGGQTIGMRQAGFEVKTHLEEGAFGAATVRHNMPDIDVRVGVENWHPKEFTGKVDYLFTNPPCAAWSAGGYKVRKIGPCECGSPDDNHLRSCPADRAVHVDDRWTRDARVDCTRRMFDLMDEVEPKIFSWECVARAEQAADFQKDRIAFCWERGYDVHAILFDGYDAGLPSRRKRFFFVATSLVFDAVRPDVRPRMTPRMAWEGLDPGPVVPLGKNEQAVIDVMPPGRGQLSKSFSALIAKRVNDYEVGRKVAGRPSFMHRRLGWDEPSFTVAGGQHLYHPELPRSLTVAEQAALLGYPRDYVFVGKPTSQYAQIGKAVTPPAAKWLGVQVRRALDRNVPVDDTHRESVLWDFLDPIAEHVQTWYQP